MEQFLFKDDFSLLTVLTGEGYLGELSVITHSHVVPNPQDFRSSSDHK